MLSKPIAIPDALKQFSQREFAGEKLRWAHQPPPRTAFTAGLVVWFFAIPWTAFSLFWEGVAISQYLQRTPKTGGMGHVVMVLWGIPFVLIGLVMMSAPVWGWYRARNSIWLLSDKRLTLLTAQRNAVAVRSVMPADILAIERTEKTNGTGQLKLTYISTRDSDGDVKERNDIISGVANAREVELMIRDLSAVKRL